MKFYRLRRRRWLVVSHGPNSTPGWHRYCWTRRGAIRRANDLNIGPPEGIAFMAIDDVYGQRIDGAWAGGA